jgi:hypothetical protein
VFNGGRGCKYPGSNITKHVLITNVVLKLKAEFEKKLRKAILALQLED